MLKIRVRWNGKCHKHPRYDPAKDGEGGIKADCGRCGLLYTAYHKHGELVVYLRVLDEIDAAGKGVTALTTSARAAFAGSTASRSPNEIRNTAERPQVSPRPRPPEARERGQR